MSSSSHDAGSPPMVPPEALCVGHDAAKHTPNTPDADGFIPVGKGQGGRAGHTTSGAPKKEDTAAASETHHAEFTLTSEDISGATAASQPALAAATATLSDVDKEALTDPSTADLVAAATAATATAASGDGDGTATATTPADTPAVNTSTPLTTPGGELLLEPLPDAPDNQLAKGSVASGGGVSGIGGGGTGGAGSSAVDTSSTSAVGPTATDRLAVSGQGSKGASDGAAASDSAASAAAGGNDSSTSDVSLPTPAAAAKMAGVEEAASPGAAAVSGDRAKAAAAEELPEKGGQGEIITPADFAATSLAAFEAEADAANEQQQQQGGDSDNDNNGSYAPADRSTSFMTDRTDSGWYDRSYSGVLGHSSAVYLAGMEPVSEREGEVSGDLGSEEPPGSTEPHSAQQHCCWQQQQPGDKQIEEEGGEAAATAESYPALAQTPAEPDDAAAVPAPPQPSTQFRSDQPKAEAAGAEGAVGGGGGDAASGGQQAHQNKDEGRKALPLADTSSPFASMSSGKESGKESDVITPAASAPAAASAADTPGSEPNKAAAGSAVAEAPAGDDDEAPSGGLSNPLKAVMEAVGDAAEAVKDVLIGTDV